MGTPTFRFGRVTLRRKPRYVSLFTGAGGLDIGLERAGLKAISLSEVEEVFCGTLEANQKKKHVDGVNYFRDARILNADIREVSGADLADTGVDVVGGGPRAKHFPVLASNLVF